MTWDPLHRIDNDPRFIRNPEQAKAFAEYGIAKDDEVWINDRYQVRVRYLESVVPTDDEVSVPVGRDGLIHLSINAHDRSPVRNWRHLQDTRLQTNSETANSNRRTTSWSAI